MRPATRRSQRPKVVGSGTRVQPKIRRTPRRSNSGRSFITPPPYSSRTTQTSTISDGRKKPFSFPVRQSIHPASSSRSNSLRTSTSPPPSVRFRALWRTRSGCALPCTWGLLPV